MINYLIMLVIALGVYLAGKSVLQSTKKGGCVGCSCGSCSCGSNSNCCCKTPKN